MPNVAILSFSNGEVTPHIDARSDLEKYASSCRKMENMLPMIYGDATRRPGTKYIAESKNAGGTIRLIPFIYSSEIAYLCEFGEKYIRFYYDDEILMDGDYAFELSSPYSAIDLPELQYNQIGDVMWLVHKDYVPRKLTRTTTTTFSLDEIIFENGPFKNRNDIENDDDITMTIKGYAIATATSGVAGAGTFTITSSTDISALFSAYRRFYVDGSTGNDGAYTVHATTATTYSSPTLTIYVNEKIVDGTDDGYISVKGGTGTVTTSANVFDSGHEGYLFKLTQKRASNNINGTKTGTNTGVISDGTYYRGIIDVKGEFTFQTSGSWGGTIEIQRREDGENWETFRSYTYAYNGGNVQLTTTEDNDNVQYRINVTEHSAGGTVTAQLSVNSSTQDGIIRIDTVEGPQSAQITFVTACPEITATKRWAEGCWSDYRGFPSTVCFHDGRIIYGGTPNQPQTIWFSESDDYENFEEGIKDADSFSVTILTTNEILWIKSLDALAVGTTGSEYVINSNKLYTALTPTNFAARQQTTFGSAPISPLRVHNAVLFVDTMRRKIREMAYVSTEDRFEAPDMTEYSEHITAGYIAWITYQHHPDHLVWCGLQDGSLVSMMYNRYQNIIAWSKHPIDGTIQSGCTIPGDGEDKVYFAINRQIAGYSKTYIELLQSRNFTTQADAFYVDCGYLYDGDYTNTFTGLDHLEGKTVNVWGDGAVFENQIVRSGSITISNSVYKAVIGIPYRYTLQPMRMDIAISGSSVHGGFRKISEVVISFLDTLNAQYGDSLDDLLTINWRITEAYGTPPELFTGDKTIVFDGGFNPDDPIIITGNDPAPCTVRAIVPRVDFTGR